MGFGGDSASLLANATTAQIRGDYNGNGFLDAADISIMTIDIVGGQILPDEDLNGDCLGNEEDRRIWIHELAHTYYGDANVDGEFNGSDLVQIFEAGKYEKHEMANWDEGDFYGDLQFNSSDMVIAFADGGYEKGPRLIGDYNRNGLLDAGDLDLQAIAMTIGPATPGYDLNEDGVLDYDDRQIWVNDLKNTWIGDANLDLEFTPSDSVQIFAGGKYETGQTATSEEGDFTGNMKFDSGDLVAMFPVPWRHDGPRSTAAIFTVPEPGSAILLTNGVIVAFSMSRRHAPRWKRLERREI